MVFITTETWQKNGVEVIVFDNQKWLDEKHIEEKLKYSILANITIKYPEYLRKQRQELEGYIKQPCRRFLREDFAIQIIMDCRTTPAVNFKSRLGFNQHDAIMTQEQSMLTKIKSAFSTD